MASEAEVGESGSSRLEERIPGLFESRHALEIRPGSGIVDTDELNKGFTALHSALQSSYTPSKSFRKPPTLPSVEWLIVSPANGQLKMLVSPDSSENFEVLKFGVEQMYPDAFSFTPTSDSIGSHLELAPDTIKNPKYDEIAALTFTESGYAPYYWATKRDSIAEFLEGERSDLPIGQIIKQMESVQKPVLAQILVSPQPSPIVQYEGIIQSIENRQDRFFPGLIESVTLPDNESETELSSDAQLRLEAIRGKEVNAVSEVNIRIIEFNVSESLEHSLDPFRLTLSGLANRWISVEPIFLTGEDALQEVTDILEYRVRTTPSALNRLKCRLPAKASRPSHHLDSAEVSSLLAIEENKLPASVKESLDITSSDRSSIPLPSHERLTPYRTAGMHLPPPISSRGHGSEESLYLPTELLHLHTLIVGQTGSGKSLLGIDTLLSTHFATEGATFVLSPKGDGFGQDVLKTYYHHQGNLEDVMYFDAATTLPRLSFFDIRADVDAGRKRSTAITEIVDHFTSIGAQVMGEKYTDAVAAPTVLKLLIRALFDKEYGEEAFSLTQLNEAARDFQEGKLPKIGNENLRAQMEAVTGNSQKTQRMIGGGVISRLSAVSAHEEVREILEYSPENPTAGFDLESVLDENKLIIIDTGALHGETQDAIGILVLSELWKALKRRANREAEEVATVTLHLEEASSIAPKGILNDLLSQGRGFGLATTISTQFPKQLKADETSRTYYELLNNIGTVIAGRVNIDDEFAKRLAHGIHSEEAMAKRLRGLPRDRWLVDLPSTFGQEVPSTFEARAGPIPPGHPKSESPLTDSQLARFREEFETIQARTLTKYGTHSERKSFDETHQNESPVHTESDHRRTTLPYTEHLPKSVKYDDETDRIECRDCGRQYPSGKDGLVRAVNCHSSLRDIDRDSFPVVETLLTLSASERIMTDRSLAELMFIQVLENVRRRRYSDIEFDIVRDSMRLLREYVGIHRDSVEVLIEDGLVKIDTNRPHLIYSPTKRGRQLLSVRSREGDDFGEGIGDWQEENEHVFMVEIGKRYLEHAYADDDESPVRRILPYYEHEDNVVDIVGVDSAGEVRIAVEAEQAANDRYESAPADFDTIADLEPDEALWITPSRDEGHKILQALSNPQDNNPRIEHDYTEGTGLHKRQFDSRGLTDIVGMTYLRSRVMEFESEEE